MDQEGQKANQSEVLAWLANFECSFFSDAFSSEQMGRLQIQPIYFDDPKEFWIADSNFNAAISLMQHRQNRKTKPLDRQTKEFIDKVLKEEPHSVHARCNEAMYHLIVHPIDVVKAYSAKCAAEAAYNTDKNAKLAAQVHYGYRMSTMVDDEDVSKEGYEYMKSIFRNLEKPIDITFHYYYAKGLVQAVKRRIGDADEVMCALVGQFSLLYQSKNPIYQQQVNLDVINLLLSKETLKLLFKHKSPAPNMESDLEKTVELLGNPKVKVYSNTYRVIGRGYLKMAQDEQVFLGKQDRYLKLGYEYASMYKDCDRKSRVQLAPLTCAQIQLYIWAVKYYTAFKDYVETCYKEQGSDSTRTEVRRGAALEFLTIKYYAAVADDDPERKQLLITALDHLDEHFLSNRDVRFAREYPVLLALLGTDDADIARSFDGPLKVTGDEGTTRFYNDRDSYIALQMKGLFFEARGRFYEAKEKYEAALEMNPRSSVEHLKRILQKINKATGSR